jgi:serine O-acetyltransferase
MSEACQRSEPAKRVVLGVAAACMAPMLLLYGLSGCKDIIRGDVARWAEVLEWRTSSFNARLLGLLAAYPEFRNLFYYRVSSERLSLKVLAQLFNVIFRDSSTLSLSARHSIGPGLFIEHGFSTVVAADSIGANCLIRQQVTIGYTTRSDCPRLGNHVVVGAGAKVLGAVHVGDHVVVGANAVVVKDVPDNCVVVGVPARIVRRNGVRVDEALV